MILIRPICILFVAIFDTNEISSEEEFETLLWNQLNYIHQQDMHDWDPTVNSDPAHSNFSFSIAGHAFFVIGMHPNASRKARRSPKPTIAFNLHVQFEKLREMGVFQNIRDRIRKRDKKLQGSVNPMVRDFGDSREAMQYSGRKVDTNWICPFKPKLKMIKQIEKQSGIAFTLKKGQRLKVIDPQGEQVSDMVLFNKEEPGEKLSSGKTLDYEETILITKGNFLWSNRSRKMMEILEDTNGRNDFLLAPCSPETFQIMYNNPNYHPSCFENLSESLKPFGISSVDIPNAFNIFMNVQFDSNGKLSVEPPLSKAVILCYLQRKWI